MNRRLLCWMFIISLAETFAGDDLGSLSKDIRRSESNSGALVHSRRRRYVVFPEGSTLTVAACVSPTALSGTGAIFTNGVAWALSYDLPNETIHDDYRRPNFPVPLKRHKRDLFVRMEKLMDSAGLDGRSCILKTICETAQTIIPRKGVLEEILRLIFTYPMEKESDSGWLENKQYEEAHQAGELDASCDDLFPCPFSLLQIGLGFGKYPQTIL